MDVPDLVRQSLGDEEIVAGVSLGDEDAVCFTPTRALVYRGEGLLSDEGVSEYPLDFERLAISEGRRKTKFTLTYVDRETDFTVPGKRTEPVLERLLEGTLHVGDLLDADESVTGAFRFSEMTLIISQHRVLKHVGGYTWDDDFEVFPFDEVTGLHFEDGSVATAIVLEVDGRSERIKAPNEQARVVRKTLEEAMFAHFDVGSLESLNHEIGVEDDDAAGETDASQSRGLDFESGIDPLVSDSGEEADAKEADSESPEAETTGDQRDQTGAEQSAKSTGERGEQAVGQSASTAEVDDAAVTADARSEELAAVTAQLDELTTVVERQNKLLKQQQHTVKQLIEELRQGR